MTESPAPGALRSLGLRIRSDVWRLLLLGFAAIPAGMTADIPSAPLRPANSWALLVGVSEYPKLAAERQLRGPSHDISAMRDALQSLQSEWRSITVLADHVENADGLPSRKAIVAAFNRLARQVGRNDYVVVYFSGHGSQQPAAADDGSEPDGLDEILLPRDVGKWDGAAGTVRNAITDNELHALFAPLLQKGANVWAIFDACHSGSVTRGFNAANETVRSVNPAELGVPMHGAVRKSQRTHASAPAPANAGELVVFSAAQSSETTPELRLPPGDPRRVQRGLFSYAVLQALAAMGPSTYQELAQYIVAHYASMNRVSPTPLFEGSLSRSIPLGETRQHSLGLSLRVFSASRPEECQRLDAAAGSQSLGQGRPLQNLRAGDSLCAVLDNQGPQPVDVTLLYVNAERSAHPLFPLRGESNRIAPGKQQRIALAVVADAESSLDTIVALAVVAHSGSERVQLPWPAPAASAAIESSRDMTLAPAPVWMQAVRWISLPKQLDAR